MLELRIVVKNLIIRPKRHNVTEMMFVKTMDWTTVRSNLKVIYYSLYLGLLFGIIETLFDYIFFSDLKPFWQVAVSNVPDHSFFTRWFIMFAFFLAGLMIILVKNKNLKIEKKYNELFSSMSIGLAVHKIIYDKENKPIDYQTIDANVAYEKMTGIKKIDYLKKKASEIYKYRQFPFLEKYSNAASSGQPISFETDYPLPQKNFKITVFSLAVDIFATLFEDISSFKEAEDDLRETKNKYYRLVEGLQEGIWVIDKGAYITFVNPRMAEILGHNVNEMIGRHIYAFMDENNIERFKANLVEIEHGIKEDQFYEFVTKDGSIIYTSFKTTPLHDKNNKYIGSFACVIDITGRKKAEESLRQSERRYQEIFNSVMEGIGSVDQYDRIQYLNPAYARIFDEDSVKNMIGKSIFDYIPDENKEKIVEQNEMRKNGISSQYEISILTAQNRKKTILISASPRFNEVGEYIGSFSALMDVSEIRKLQDFNMRAQRLETAGRIAGQVAHDFNNLLAPLTAYPELIRQKLPENHKALSYLARIESSAEQIAEINQQLLTLGRRGHYNQEPINLNNIIETAINQIKPLLKPYILDVNLSAKLMNIKGGKSQIHRVISNLVTNAIDAMKSGGTLTIRTENFYADEVTGKFGRIPRGEYVKVTVSDTGSGIPKDILSKIWDPFFTTKMMDKKRGSGLGLSVVYAVVEDHHGFIDLSSEPGEGTTFYLYFPITREIRELEEKEQLVGGIEKILVVDDDSVQLEVSKSLLSNLGYDVQTINSGEKALDILRTETIDLLVLDMVMPPGIDGAETYRRALEINPGQKAIIISGYAETERVDYAKKLGIGSYIRKPLTLRAIASVVRKELDKNSVSLNNLETVKS